MVCHRGQSDKMHIIPRAGRLLTSRNLLSFRTGENRRRLDSPNSGNRICLGHKKINFSTVFASQAVGIKEVHDGTWLVSFMDYDLGYFDLDARVLEPLENPFGPKVLPMWPVRSVTHLSGLDPK